MYFASILMETNMSYTLYRIQVVNHMFYLIQDQTIANLGKEISGRDDKIAILENQVNELGDEVERLQTSLATMLDIGENRGIRNHEVDKSLKLMEAHRKT